MGHCLATTSSGRCGGETVGGSNYCKDHLQKSGRDAERSTPKIDMMKDKSKE